MSKHFFKRSTSGMSLMEVVIVAGIASVVMLTLTQISMFGLKAQKSVELSAEFTSLTSTLQLILNNNSACKKAFVDNNVVFNPSGPFPQNLTSIVVGGSTIVSTLNQPTQGLKVTEIQFTNSPAPEPLGGNLYLVNLHLGGVKVLPGQAATSGQNLSQDFTLTVEIDPSSSPANKIISCYGQSSASQSAQDICSDLGGTYSPSATPKCSLANNSLKPFAVTTRAGGFVLPNNANGTLQNSLAGLPITVPANTFSNGIKIEATVEVDVWEYNSSYVSLWVDVLASQTGVTVSLSGKPTFPADPIARGWHDDPGPAVYPYAILGAPALMYGAGDGDNDGGGRDRAAVLHSVGYWVKSTFSGTFPNKTWQPDKATTIDFGNLYYIVSRFGMRIGRTTLTISGF